MKVKESTWMKLLIVIGIVGIMGSLFGAIGAMIFDNNKIGFIGMSICAVSMVIIWWKVIQSYYI